VGYRWCFFSSNRAAGDGRSISPAWRKVYRLLGEKYIRSISPPWEPVSRESYTEIFYIKKIFFLYKKYFSSFTFSVFHVCRSALSCELGRERDGAGVWKGGERRILCVLIP